ncbi:MAG: hypothetical protein ABEK50_05955 [bacterium]
MVGLNQIASGSLLFLGILDGLLAFCVFFRPTDFHRWFFGRPPEGSGVLLTRTGGIWLTFSVLQLTAFFLWNDNPFWLLLVTGVRLSEWCADWLLLLTEQRFTILGSMGFLLSSPFTISFALLFYGTFAHTQVITASQFSIGGFSPLPWVLDGLLVGLSLVDLVLAYLALFDHEQWLEWFHSSDKQIDREWLTRTGGVWLGFAVLQLVALGLWRSYPALLIIIGGVRLTESLADWIYLSVLERTKTVVAVCLCLSPPANIALAYVFYQGYFTIQVF